MTVVSPGVYEALERHLVARYQLFDEETADGVLGQPGECGVLVAVFPSASSDSSASRSMRRAS